MGHSLTVKKNHLFCGIVLLLCLLPGQSEKLFGISSGIEFQIIFFLRYFATALLFAYALSQKQKVPTYEIWRFLYIFAPLMVLMLIVECCAAFTSPIPVIYGVRYWTRSLYIFGDRICVYIAVVSIWMLCVDNAVDCLANTLLIDELLLFISAIPHVGFSGIAQSALSAFAFRGFTSNYFEVHEQTYVIGLCIVYYLFFEKRRRHDRIKLILLIVCFILGAKRIGLLGIVVAGCMSMFIHKKGLSRRQLVLMGMAGVGICFFYLFIIYNDTFFSLLNEYGVNNMGRDLIYGYFTRRTKLSPSQIGWGMAGVAKAVENMDRSEVLYMQAVRGLHNDILKIYINFGFVGSLVWYTINLLYFPVVFFKKYGTRPATIYITLSLYMFITYLTDNTESYNVCQMAFLLIPMVEYWTEKIKRERAYLKKELTKKNMP